VAKAGHPCLPGPLPLQNVKEQARERRTRATLPHFDGNATKNFKKLHFSSDPGFSAFALRATADKSAENGGIGGAPFASC
jgi:hypothetical protein